MFTSMLCLTYPRDCRWDFMKTSYDHSLTSVKYECQETAGTDASVGVFAVGELTMTSLGACPPQLSPVH